MKLACICLLLFGFETSTELARKAIDKDKLTKQLIVHEGKRAAVYKDSEGIPTIGVGFNLLRLDAKRKLMALQLDYEEVRKGNVRLTEEQILTLLSTDIDNAVKECQSLFPNFRNLSDVRKRVLADMMFNLGKPRLSKFKKMIAAVEEKDFVKAAHEMKDSKWYRQVKTRGKTLVQMMKTGTDVISELNKPSKAKNEREIGGTE